MELYVTVTGTRPLIEHNGRLANPLDPWTRALKEITSKRKKTDEDLAAIMQIESRGACWETNDGLLGVLNGALWSCIFEAAKAFKRGMDIKRAFIADPGTEPLRIDGEHVSCDEWLKDPEHIDYRSVALRGNRTMRARPIIPLGWASTHRFELLTDVIDPRDLIPILERAGRLVGLGEMRPTYGAFTIELIP